MASSRGYKMALAGLVVGIAIGIVIVVSKEWLSHEIIDALDDEIRASCECTFAFDSLDISYAALSATVTNPRILERGVTKLSFGKVTAKVSLDDISNKNILLTKVNLFDGTAHGAGPDSVLFRFVDRLTESTPPEKDRPGRWKVKLVGLDVYPTKISEPLRGGSLEAENVTLSVLREGEQFVLTPRIGKLALRLTSSDSEGKFREIPLGTAKSSVLLGDMLTKFRSLALNRGENSVTSELATLSNENDDLRGPLHFDLGFDYLDVPAWLRGRFLGSGEFDGVIGNPQISGTFRANETDAPYVTLGSFTFGRFPNMGGNVFVDLNHGAPYVEITDLRGSNETFTVSTTKPLHISSELMQGKLGLVSERFEIGGVVANDLAVDISFEGESGRVITDLSGKVRKLEIFGQDFGPVQSQAEFKDEILTVKAKSQGNDRVSFTGALDFKSEGMPTVHNGKITFDRFPIFRQDDAESQPTISGLIDVEGLWDISAITGQGKIALYTPSAQSQLVSGDLNLKDASVAVTMKNEAGSLVTGGTVDLRKGTGTAQVQAKNLDLKSVSSRVGCGSASWLFDYEFSTSAPMHGGGTLRIDNATTGCEPYELFLKGQYTLPVIDGALQLKSVGIMGFHTEVSLNGAISPSTGYDLKAHGSMQLNSLISYVTAAENLRGNLMANVHVTGPLTSPSFKGDATFSDGEIAFDSPDISLHDVHGGLKLDDQKVSVSDFRGQINGGNFTLQGTIIPFDMTQSRLETHLENIQISPMEDALLVFSGDLALLTNDAGRATLSGTITFEEGDFKKDLNPNRMIIQAVSGLLFPGRKAEEVSGASSLPDIDLDMKLTAPRNLFVNTTFLGSELMADLKVNGTLKSPQVTGSMRTLRGWIGLKGNRFEITSGQVEFKPDALEPLLEIVAEGNVRSNTGENILVIVEASGPLRSPKIALSSDRGLSHDELLLLITSTSTFFGRTQANRVSTDLTNFSGSTVATGPFSGLRSFFRNITQIDTLAFEPVYSPYSGAVEPAIVAQKRLTERLALVAESTFGTISDSKAGVVYSLAPEIALSGSAESVSTRRNTALAADLTVTVLTDKDQFVKIQISGTEKIADASVLQALRLSQSSRVRPDDVPALEKSIVSLYTSKGYLKAGAKALCEDDTLFCRKLTIDVQEGGLSHITSIDFVGDDLKKALPENITLPVSAGDPAEQVFLEEIEETLLKAVRSEGYLGARITARYLPTEGTDSVTLQITSVLEQPMTFVFKGNTAFTPEDFLNSIDLFKRKRPFGNNTIKVLVQNIERMYRDAGNFYVVVNVTESDDNGRTVYSVNITEDIKANPGKVTFEGNATLQEEEILSLVRLYDLADPSLIKYPAAIVPDQLETIKNAIVEVYVEEGFPRARVDYQLRPNDSGSTIDVVYSVAEGERVRVASIDVKGLPGEVATPSLPPGSISIPKMNRYVTSIIDSLRNAGYLYPSALSEIEPTSGNLIVTVEPGPSTKIDSIQIGGLSRVDESIVRKYVALSPGDAWTIEKVSATRRGLLRLGLFSRVDISPADGTLDSDRETMVIRVYERALQTLELGGGANSEFGLHLFGEAVDKSLFSDGRSLALRLDTYFDQNAVDQNTGSGPTISQGFASARYLDPDFADSEYSFSEELRLQRQDLSTQEFDQDRVSLSTYWYRQLASGIGITGGHTLLVDNLDNVSPGAILGDLDSGSVRLGFLSGSIRLDRRDDPLIPNSGYTLRLDPKIAAQILGSEGDYATLVGRATAVVPLDDLAQRFSIGFGLSAGGSWTFGETDDVPITQRFYLGGRSTVRGFRENSLGPRGAGGAVIGGDTLLAGSTQLQYLFSEALSVHTFLDSGSVFLRERTISASDLRWSTGVGMRYLSPIGPIGFDIGHPLDEKDGEPSFRIHFSVGSSF